MNRNFAFALALAAAAAGNAFADASYMARSVNGGVGSPASYDPEVDFDRAGHLPFHSASDSRATLTRVPQFHSFDPEVDADRIGRVPMHVVAEPRALAVRNDSFDPEVDSDRNLAKISGQSRSHSASRKPGARLGLDG